jgi:hypothetical protein
MVGNSVVDTVSYYMASPCPVQRNQVYLNHKKLYQRLSWIRLLPSANGLPLSDEALRQGHPAAKQQDLTGSSAPKSI